MKIILICIATFSFKAFTADCIAHRGYLLNSVENSLDSIQNAIEAGADGIEFDIRHTKDGVPFLLHDSTLERVVDQTDSSCPYKEKVKNLKWNEIVTNCRLKDGQELITLESLLERTTFFTGSYFIELKDKPSSTFREVIDSSGADFQKIRFISFRLKFLSVVRDFFPSIESLRLSKFIPFLAWSRGMNVHYPLKPFSWLARILGHENGVWTVNSLKKLIKYHKRKVDFITTDELQLCLDAKEMSLKL